MLRFHTQTAGCVVDRAAARRTTWCGCVAGSGGGAGRHAIAAYRPPDEALALPTEEAARIALRTQQIIAYESGVAQTIDPLAGSYFLERLTLDMEEGAFDYFGKLDQTGGMVHAIERGYPQKEIAEASYQYQAGGGAKEKILVGVNEFAIEQQSPETLYIDDTVQRQQTAKLKQLRAERSSRRRCGAASMTSSMPPRRSRRSVPTAKFPTPTPCPSSSRRCAPMPRWEKSARR